MKRLIFMCALFVCNTPSLFCAKKAIIVGATSGIGRALAKQLANNSYEVGITGRRTELLQSLKQELPTKSYIKTLDVRKTDESIKQLTDLIKEMKAIDLVVLNAGIGWQDDDLDWSHWDETIAVNVHGFTAMANVALHYFKEQKAGHLVGITSVTGVRPMPEASVYAATKAYGSAFLAGIRHKLQRQNLPIYVTDIIPGFVDTDMVKGPTFWQATPEEAAHQIYEAIQEKREYAYVTKRWQLVAWLLKTAPNWLYNLVNPAP